MHTINEVKEFMTPENAEDLLTNIQVSSAIFYWVFTTKLFYFYI